VVRNNVVMDNSSAVGALSLRGFGGSTFYASNNTIVNNVTAVNGAPGVQLSGVATDFHWFINNVMWNNRILGGGPFRDLVLLAPAGVVNSNSYRELLNGSGSMAISQSITAEPLFVSPTNPRLTPGSPLRDSGNNTPAGGILPIDFDLQPRFQGGQLDRGAFELSDVLFKNGFQNP
jgi:hypothetical protein